jgi:hypothetical protein
VQPLGAIILVQMGFSTRDFVRLAEEVFAWLQDRGFRVLETSAENHYGSVLFGNEVTHVRVALDIHDQSLDVGVRAALEANSQALEEAASDVLSGDFTIFSRADLADSARIEANIAGRPWPNPRNMTDLRPSRA